MSDFLASTVSCHDRDRYQKTGFLHHGILILSSLMGTEVATRSRDPGLGELGGSVETIRDETLETKWSTVFSSS